MSVDRFEIHQHITDQIIAMLDQPRIDFQLPWHVPGGLMRPVNAATKNPYRGVNVLSLWAAGEVSGFISGIWATYRQWTSLGAQVRKGEKASYVVFYKNAGGGSDEPNNSGADAGAAGAVRADRLITRASAVFAAEQVEGYMRPETRVIAPMKALAHAEAFVAATGATIQHEGHQAFYRPSTDTIHVPAAELFLSSQTSSATQAYYATLFHELTHWTGHASRCARDLGSRFGQDAYAMEELVAELGAAFVSADLNISPTPREDHAHYLAHWLAVLKNDKRAIFTAASKAAQAAGYLQELQPSLPVQAGIDETSGATDLGSRDPIVNSPQRFPTLELSAAP